VLLDLEQVCGAVPDGREICVEGHGQFFFNLFGRVERITQRLGLALPLGEELVRVGIAVGPADKRL
jgi:hypothetical protein